MADIDKRYAILTILPGSHVWGIADLNCGRIKAILGLVLYPHKEKRCQAICGQCGLDKCIGRVSLRVTPQKVGTQWQIIIYVIATFPKDHPEILNKLKEDLLAIEAINRIDDIAESDTPIDLLHTQPAKERCAVSDLQAILDNVGVNPAVKIGNNGHEDIDASALIEKKRRIKLLIIDHALGDAPGIMVLAHDPISNVQVVKAGEDLEVLERQCLADFFAMGLEPFVGERLDERDQTA